MRSAPLSTVLLDVGGTLWANKWTSMKADDEARSKDIRKSIPWISRALSLDIIRELEVGAKEMESGLTQDSDHLIEKVAQKLGLYIQTEQIVAIRKAMCLPALGRVDMFAGARELLASIKQPDLQCVIVTNATWRDGQDYRRDFQRLGISDYIDTIISSVDVGFRKPHRAIFDAAVSAAHCEPQQCVVIGDSEQNDVQPALSLGMRCIRVAVEEPEPEVSHAHRVVGSLYEAAAVIRAWAT